MAKQPGNPAFDDAPKLSNMGPDVVDSPGMDGETDGGVLGRIEQMLSELMQFIRDQQGGGSTQAAESPKMMSAFDEVDPDDPNQDYTGPDDGPTVAASTSEPDGFISPAKPEPQEVDEPDRSMPVQVDRDPAGGATLDDLVESIGELKIAITQELPRLLAEAIREQG